MWFLFTTTFFEMVNFFSGVENTVVVSFVMHQFFLPRTNVNFFSWNGVKDVNPCTVHWNTKILNIWAFIVERFVKKNYNPKWQFGNDSWRELLFWLFHPMAVFFSNMIEPTEDINMRFFPFVFTILRWGAKV